MLEIDCSVLRTPEVMSPGPEYHGLAADRQGASVAENKTQPTTASVTAFLDAIEDKKKKSDAKIVAAMMRKATGCRAKMWGPSIVGYGKYHYRYSSGREGDWMLVGFSPRKQNLSVYIMPGFKPFASLLKRLGKYKTGKSCLYINSLADVDEAVLEQLVASSVKHMRERYDVK